MLSVFTFIGVCAAIVAGSPFPPEATVQPARPNNIPHFGNNKHAVLDQKDSSNNSTFRLMATGQYVRGPAARYDTNWYDGIGRGADWYTMYWGDGGYGHGWPPKEKWVSFVDMFEANKAIMFNSCEWNGWAQNNLGEEVGAIWDAIDQVARETNVDHRFILAIMIQESGGCVRVKTTNNGIRNPGLMQCFAGAGTCNADYPPYQVQYPCPRAVITTMIREGTAGTRNGDGLAELINHATEWWGPTDARAFYMAARLYNSGYIDPSMKLELGITAQNCYASDIANRLTGWVLSEHRCYLD